MARIDPVTADRIRNIILASRSQGVDPVAILDRAGMLNYEAARREWAAIIMDQVVAELSIGPLGLAINGRQFRTPMDMKREILEALEGFARQWRSEATGSRVPWASTTPRNKRERDG